MNSVETLPETGGAEDVECDVDNEEEDGDNGDVCGSVA